MNNSGADAVKPAVRVRRADGGEIKTVVIRWGEIQGQIKERGQGRERGR